MGASIVGALGAWGRRKRRPRRRKCALLRGCLLLETLECGGTVHSLRACSTRRTPLPSSRGTREVNATNSPSSSVVGPGGGVHSYSTAALAFSAFVAPLHPLKELRSAAREKNSLASQTEVFEF